MNMPTAQRNQKIRQLRNVGMSYGQIAKRFGLTYQRVQQIVRTVPGGEHMRARGPFHCPECDKRYVFPSGIHWHLHKAHGYTHTEANVWIEHDEIMRNVHERMRGT